MVVETYTLQMDTSPNWKRPTDILRLHKKKRRTGSLSRSFSANNLDIRHRKTSSPQISQTSLKRKNPFKCSPNKKIHLSTEDSENDSNDSAFLNLLDDHSLKKADFEENNKCVVKQSDAKQNFDSLEEKSTSDLLKNEEDETTQPEGQTLCPVDWCLKMKARFISEKPFNWCSPIKTAEEAKAISSHLQCHHRRFEDWEVNANKNKISCHQHCIVWQHPNIPWLKLFPRITSDNRIGQKSFLNQDEEIQKTLLADWTDSFSSGFHMVRAGQCPYLYMCAHQFTVLFRAAGTAGQKQMHALLTPTSRGFREAIKCEGVEFSMPLDTRRMSGGSMAAELATVPTHSQQSSENIPPNDNNCVDADMEPGEPKKLCKASQEEGDEEEEEICHTDDGASTWLHNLGLDTAKYRSLDPNKVKLQRDSYREIDNRPESTIFVEGSDTLALLNFLLSSRSCVATSGVQNGIPPTLLAPVAFKGAVMKSLQVKTGVIRLGGETPGSTKLAYMSEVIGPILPHTAHNLSDLFSHTQDTFTASFSCHEPTASFNASLRKAHAQEEETAEESEETRMKPLIEAGVGEYHARSIVKETFLGKQVMRGISYKDSLFNYTT